MPAAGVWCAQNRREAVESEVERAGGAAWKQPLQEQSAAAARHDVLCLWRLLDAILRQFWRP